MKVTIDTTNKTIKVEDQVNFCELNKELKKLLGDTVKEYTLLPIENIITPYPHYVPQYPSIPFWQIITTPETPVYPYITYTENT